MQSVTRQTARVLPQMGKQGVCVCVCVCVRTVLEWRC
uniref:GH18422p n=1 Tax=Drosophila melanogaster TaxID=7227 RepID=Q2PDV1_DROME|nr:GH18422p [Drosophila melanogaster]